VQDAQELQERNIIEDLGGKLLKAFEKLIDDPVRLDFEINIGINLDGDEKVTPLEGIQNLGLFPKFSFINTTIDIHLEFYFELKFNVLDQTEYDLLDGDDDDSKFASFAGEHLAEARLGFETTKDLNIGLQMEVTMYVKPVYELHVRQTLTLYTNT
jgi:hypothetical protein